MKHQPLLILSILGLIVIIILLIFLPDSPATTRIVPDDYPTIQRAINAANPGDVIQVRPGTYLESVTINKSVSLIAFSFNPDDPTQNATIIDSGEDDLLSTIVISPGISPMPVIQGFLIRNGDDGIKVSSEAVIENNFFYLSKDQLDFEAGGGGIVRNNVFYRSSDDGIDLDDLDRSILIENNRLMYNGDDGIEIRLQDSSAPSTPVTATIQNNQIIGCGEDGIQFIDYSQTKDTNRRFIITGNLIANCAFAGIGMMPDANTNEDYSGADVLETVHTYNNTFYGNEYGISGGDNHMAFNNIFVNTAVRAVWRVQGLGGDDSVVAYSLFFNNGENAQSSTLGDGNLFHQDPLFDSLPNPGPDGLWNTVDDDFSGLTLSGSSPAVDAGITQYMATTGDVIPPTPIAGYSGAGPDLGWKEFGGTQPPVQTPSPSPN